MKDEVATDIQTLSHTHSLRSFEAAEAAEEGPAEEDGAVSHGVRRGHREGREVLNIVRNG
jgi:hypothetical protein